MLTLTLRKDLLVVWFYAVLWRQSTQGQRARERYSRTRWDCQRNMSQIKNTYCPLPSLKNFRSTYNRHLSVFTVINTPPPWLSPADPAHWRPSTCSPETFLWSHCCIISEWCLQNKHVLHCHSCCLPPLHSHPISRVQAWATCSPRISLNHFHYHRR